MKRQHPPPAPVPAPEPEPAKLKLERVEATAKDAGNPVKHECCGSKFYRHKKSCANADAVENDADATEKEEDAPAPAEISSETEDEEAVDQEFACKECGNMRMEPHGTAARVLDCPNSWSDPNPEKHVYELNNG